MQLILASSSRYRQAMLERLRVPFIAISPDVDETPTEGEQPAELAVRLSIAKSKAILQRYPDALIIGSDQVASVDGNLIGKPGSFERARQQLKQLSGRIVEFHSALCLSNRTRHETVNVITHCQFRHLDDQEIDSYLVLEQPFDTAGSAKAEGLGIALMESMQSDDPTAIIGLPLIALCRLLRTFGVNPLIDSEAS